MAQETEDVPSGGSHGQSSWWICKC